MAQTHRSDASQASTVGRAFESNQIYSLDHPEYQHFARQVEAALARVAQREAQRREAARKVVVTASMSSECVANLEAEYPEFSLTVVPFRAGGDAMWAVSRQLANEWLVGVTDQYAGRVVHFGGSLASAVMEGRTGWHVEVDASDAVMAHDEYADACDMHRLYSDLPQLQHSYGVQLSRATYDQHLCTGKMAVCRQPHVCTHEAEAMCVDLSVALIGPEQIAQAMRQHGAELCHGFFPYTPAMLVQDSGEMGNTGVTFRKNDNLVHLAYPGARGGLSHFRLDVWAKWLVSHCFRTNGGQWYQLELLKNRGPFMFFRMTQTPAPPSGFMVRHALDFTDAGEHVLVESWRLRNGLRSDPSDPGQWVEHRFLAPERVVRRVFEYAMQLDQKAFSRAAIKKQAIVVNNRFVVQGTSVTVRPPLEPQQVEDLTTALFSRAFVLRYESSRLSSEMMAALKRMVGFHSTSTQERIRAVGEVVLRELYAKVAGTPVSFMRGLLQRFLASPMPAGAGTNFRPAATYVPFVTYSNSWREVFKANGESAYVQPVYQAGNASIIPSAPGGSLATVIAKFSAPGAPAERFIDVVRLVTGLENVAEMRARDDVADGLVAKAAELNGFDAKTSAREHMEFVRPELVAAAAVKDFEGAKDPDPVHSLNTAYQSVLPGVARQNLAHDQFSLSLDPQDRALVAPYLRMSTYFGLPPASRSYYKSRLVALNVPKRQNVVQELLSAINARNLAAPAVALAQDDNAIREIWDVFLSTMCVEGAREKLAKYQADPVALSEDALREWVAKAKPGAAERVKRELEATSKALGEMKVSEYLVMLKADAKPTMSEKPVHEITAPQTIVYHEKALSALYSSIYRVLVRRFLSLLRPNVFVNLLKDTKTIAQHVTAFHPFAAEGLKYLENDFSKFDKSQSQFVFDLERYVFQQLGMNEAFLAQWAQGHVECSMRALGMGLSLHVLYQRKSGDATTAFGNVVLNVLSTAYAYRGTSVVWAVYMGDDSLVCASAVNVAREPVRLMAEVFNLTAKYYITDAPYFASNFFLIDEAQHRVVLVPDPVKRIERLSMYISADDPQWHERYVSFCDAMSVYREAAVLRRVAAAVCQRYEAEAGLVYGAASALGTLTCEEQAFRSLWEDEPCILDG